jgi:glycosyltransferase involved in cell wall biosynthesis
MNTQQPPTTGSFSVVCLSSQDWDAPLPTNRQQIMGRAARRGHAVLFVETGGFFGRHLWRLVRGPRRRSLARRLTVGEDVGSLVRVQKLICLLPFGQRYALVNRLNWRIGGLAIRAAARRLAPPRVAWLYDPRAVEALGTLAEVFAVYDCVDDYAEQTSDARRRDVVAAADREAAERSRLVFATATPLVERHTPRNPHTYHVPNVGDFEHFAPASDRSLAPTELQALPRPVLGFSGNLEPLKVDFDLLAGIADRLPDATILLAGPARSSVLGQVRELASRSNVHWLGLQSYAALPRVVAAFDVALIPYLENDYTRSCFPLKVYEYLAAGKPVVATGLPELAKLAPDVLLTAGTDQAVAAVELVLAEDDAARARRIARAAANTWETRTSRLLALVRDELAS